MVINMPIKANQLALIVLCGIAVVLYWQNYQKTFGDKGRLNVTKRDNAVVLSWQTSIDVPMAKRFEEAYAQWREKTNKFIINLDSNGGSLREGRQVIELIERMKKTHLVQTTVGENASCLSMCVPIYLRGEERTAATTSRWMFHEPTAYHFVTGEKADRDDQDRRKAGERFFQNYFANSEMNPAWREKLQQAWIGRDIWLSGKQLYDQNSNIILKLY